MKRIQMTKYSLIVIMTSIVLSAGVSAARVTEYCTAEVVKNSPAVKKQLCEIGFKPYITSKNECAVLLRNCKVKIINQLKNTIIEKNIPTIHTNVPIEDDILKLHVKLELNADESCYSASLVTSPEKEFPICIK